MIGDRQHGSGYGPAIVTLGLVLAVVLASLCWVATEKVHVPGGLWVAAATLGGLFAGALIPFSPRMRPKGVGDSDCWARRAPWAALVGASIVAGLSIAAFVAALVRDPSHDSVALYALGAALGGLLIGLLIPSPSGGD